MNCRLAHAKMNMAISPPPINKNLVGIVAMIVLLCCSLFFYKMHPCKKDNYRFSFNSLIN